MEIITSGDNQKVKNIIKLYDKKYRDKEGLFVAEGVRWIFDAVENNAQIELIAVREPDFEKFKDWLRDLKDKTIVLCDAVFSKVAQTESSQGILAVFKTALNPFPCKGNHILFLDRVRDPGNMGTIIRTACAAGYGDIVLNNCVDIYNPKVVRSSMSALLKVRFYEGGAESLEQMKKSGYKIITADIGGEDVFKLKEKPQKLCLVIGNEADGISENVKRVSDMSVEIPMENIESLNAAVSAGILMYLLKY